MRPHTWISAAGGWDTSAREALRSSDPDPRLQAAARILLSGAFRGPLTRVEV